MKVAWPSGETAVSGTHRFWAAYLVATHHPGISAKQLSRRLGLRYENAWLILQKLRRAMIAPERSPLRGRSRWTSAGSEVWSRESRVARPGSRDLVGVAVEVRGQGSGRLGPAPLADAAVPTLNAFVAATTAPGAIVHTDGWRGYGGLAAEGYDHRPRSQRAGVGEEPFLPPAHRSISNLKAWMLGTHRGVSKEHLPVYLDEFVLLHDRRRTPMAAFQIDTLSGGTWSAIPIPVPPAAKPALALALSPGLAIRPPAPPTAPAWSPAVDTRKAASSSR